MDLKDGSMITEDLSKKRNVESMIPLDPTIILNRRSWIPQLNLATDLGYRNEQCKWIWSYRISDPTESDL